MFCLRSWLPLLLIPCNAPPAFTLTFFFLNFLANRPCLYCSLLLVTLFATSSYWAPAPFLDLTGDWFVAPLLAKNQTNIGDQRNESFAFVMEVVGATASAFGDAAMNEVKTAVSSTTQRAGWIAAGFNWIRAMSTKEIRIPCVDVAIRL